MVPVVAKVVDVFQFGSDPREDLAELGFLGVADFPFVFRMRLAVFCPVDAEFVEMVVLPSYGYLQDAMKLVQSVVLANLYSPPNLRRDVAQDYFELIQPPGLRRSHLFLRQRWEKNF